MPPRIKIPKEKIIQTAFEITKERGIFHVNARDIAKRLNCSTQPIFYSFTTIQELKEEIKKKAKEEYNQYIKQGLQEENAYKGAGKAYIRFARQEPKLFQLLFMNDEKKEAREFIIEDDNMKEIQKEIQKITQTTPEEAIAFHFEVWIFTHGIATLLATQSAKISDEEIDNMLMDIFKAFYAKLKKEKGEENGNSNRG